MATITKTEAALLYGYGYRLVDKHQTKWNLQRISDTWIEIIGELGTRTLTYEDIGTDYHVLVHPLSRLTTEIEGIGVPLKILKTGGTNANELSNKYDSFMGNIYSICDNEEHELRYSDEFGFERRYRCELRSLNQEKLNKKLHEWHFDFANFIERGIGKEINLK